MIEVEIKAFAARVGEQWTTDVDSYWIPYTVRHPILVDTGQILELVRRYGGALSDMLGNKLMVSVRHASTQNHIGSYQYQKFNSGEEKTSILSDESYTSPNLHKIEKVKHEHNWEKEGF